MILYSAVRYYEVLHGVVFLCGAEFWTPRVARGIKGRGPCLTFDLKAGTFKFKNEARKARVGKYTSRNPSNIYTHIKKVGVVFLIDNQHNQILFL